MASYNGHPSWNAWNVSLWLNNDEGLYRAARDCVHYCRTKDRAAQRLLNWLTECGIAATPDGAPYTLTNIRRALADL